MRAADWAGAVGETWAALWPDTDRTFAAVDIALVDAVAGAVADVPAPRILDIGCGAGTTALSIAARIGDARITGIDLSPALIAAASARAATEPRCRFVVGDATCWASETGFDLLVSRHGVMFFDDPVAALGHLRSLARAGAPLVFSCFRSPAANPWASGIVALLPPPAAPANPLAPGPFAFADPDRVRRLLTDAGWSNVDSTALDYDYLVAEGPDAIDAATAFFRRIGPAASAIASLDPNARAAFVERLRGFAGDHFDGARVAFPAAAWIWTAQA